MPSFDKTRKLDDDLKRNLIKPMSDVRTDICPFCRAQRIELFSFNGYTQNYKEAVEAHLKGYDVNFNRYEIRAMKCRSCNRSFVIDWSSGFPVPLKDSYKSNRFFNEFMHGI